LAFGAMGLQKPLFADYTNRHIESKNRATVLSIISMFTGIYIAIMGLIIGGIADYSFNYAFLFMGGLIVMRALLVKIEDKHISV
jgi:MFS family permease